MSRSSSVKQKTNISANAGDIIVQGDEGAVPELEDDLTEQEKSIEESIGRTALEAKARGRMTAVGPAYWPSLTHRTYRHEKARKLIIAGFFHHHTRILSSSN